MSDLIHVTADAGATSGILRFYALSAPVMLGKGGLLGSERTKREGDGATPQGRFSLRQVYYRPDRLARPRTALPLYPIRSDDLWCDDPAHPLYNQPVSAPFPASAEAMRREDRLYDICIVLDYNLAPAIPGAGSAIFFHLTRTDENPPPTLGCVAVAPETMTRLLPSLRIGTDMLIEAG